jgi:hypothetical protein
MLATEFVGTLSQVKRQIQHAMNQSAKDMTLLQITLAPASWKTKSYKDEDGRGMSRPLTEVVHWAAICTWRKHDE